MSTPQSVSMTIYLIEDSPDYTVFISRAVRAMAPQSLVRTMPDGEIALTTLWTSVTLPDLILLDIHLPGLSGLEVLAAIKGDARLRFIPVVMLTASDLASDITRAYELGANGYISKPHSLHDLRAVLGNTLLYWSAMRRVTVGREAVS